jgi:hypothetical protein
MTQTLVRPRMFTQDTPRIGSSHDNFLVASTLAGALHDVRQQRSVLQQHVGELPPFAHAGELIGSAVVFDSRVDG